ncbi:MAG: NAD(P)-binding domain-containing protein [Calditrichaeota bacterium]|nr:NAD(P)-binding domain-containing protein [Calditrichota bacterium]
MENLYIWGTTLVLMIIIVLPYAAKSLKRRRTDHKKRDEAVKLGAHKAIAQHPQIDALRCIGCGACVDACPEGSVLGIVKGKAVIINGLKCVGHGMCAEACPVEGITVGLGDLSKRDDIPAMDTSYQTNIPGIYIAGELGGLALIKNAINQGTIVAKNIAATIEPSTNKNIYDIVIVGAGPAGLSAALTARENNLSFKILDQQGAGGTILQYPRKKLVMTKPVTIPLYGTLKKPEYRKEELLEIWEQVEKKYNLEPEIGALETIKKEAGYFEVITKNRTFYSQTVVLALGRRGTPRKLGVPGEEQSKVMYQLMDAESYTDNHILVVGGGDSAIEAAMGLARQKGNTVTISYRKEKFFRIKTRNEQRLNELVAKKEIKVVFNSEVKNIRKEDVILKYQEQEYKLKNDYVFVFAGGEPPFALLKKIGIQFGMLAENAA